MQDEYSTNEETNQVFYCLNFSKWKRLIVSAMNRGREKFFVSIK